MNKLLTALATVLCFTAFSVQAKPCITLDVFTAMMREEGATIKYRGQSVNRYFLEVYESDDKFFVVGNIDGLVCLLDRGYRLDKPA